MTADIYKDREGNVGLVIVAESTTEAFALESFSRIVGDVEIRFCGTARADGIDSPCLVVGYGSLDLIGVKGKPC
jgi:hypothetical protein